MKLFQIRIENYNGRVQQELFNITKPNEKVIKMLKEINVGFKVVETEIEIQGIVSLASLQNGLEKIVSQANEELEQDNKLFLSTQKDNGGLGRKCAMSRYKLEGLQKVEALVKSLKEGNNG